MSHKLRIRIITLFPDFISHYTGFGIIQKAIQAKRLDFAAVNLRVFAPDERGTVDDRPYGGGVGMVLRPDVLYKAIAKTKTKGAKVVLLTPQGKPFTQKIASRLAKAGNIVLVCGRYEGFDERVRSFVDEEISIGDYVLMGGELPALVVSEAVSRLIPGVVGKFESTKDESFSTNLLEYPQYTKPEALTVRGKSYRVPKVLTTGHHKNISEWRKTEAIKRTKKRRPDLLKQK
jgi:tRNA (guanine37-N1)-methyltransferase